MSGSWTVVGSPKHAEKMLIQLISATAPSWPAVQWAEAMSRPEVVVQKIFDYVQYLVESLSGKVIIECSLGNSKKLAGAASKEND